MNKEQKIIASILAPIIVAIVTGICFYILGSIFASINGVQVHGNAEDLFSFNSETWLFWGVVIVLTGIVEMSIWSDKN